jgi:hypothetical protein
VVAGVAGDGRLGRGEIGELLAVEDLRLEGVPERLDLAVCPGRVDLGPNVADRERDVDAIQPEGLAAAGGEGDDAGANGVTMTDGDGAVVGDGLGGTANADGTGDAPGSAA